VVDQDIINSVKKRDERAFKTLYESCIGYVYAIVIRYVAKESDYKDVIQEIFARVFLSIDTFQVSKGEFKFWLRRLTINLCIQHYQQQSQNYKIISLDSALSLTTDESEKLDNLSKDEILTLIKKMPEGYKQIFMLVAIDEYTHKDVSTLLNISPETSRSQFHRAKHWLKENLPSNNLKLLVDGI
jgi:RNA polymerase sigma factor (sigma-70 family)